MADGVPGPLPASWIELSILAGTFAGFVLLYMVATKFFPIVSIWEIKEGREESVHNVAERVGTYLPDPIPAHPGASAQ